MELDKKREIVSTLMGRGILIDRGMFSRIDTITDQEGFYKFLLNDAEAGQETDFTALLEKYLKTRTEQPEETKDAADDDKANTEILFSYKAEPKKREVQDFTGYFTSRYKTLSSILQHRKELQNLTSINRLNQKREREQIALIGMITDKQETKTGKIMLTAEDMTGKIKAIVSQNSDAYETAKETTLDEVLGIVGTCAGDIIFVSNLILPDIPLYKEMKKSPDEAYALFLGDFHFGSKLFLREPFEKLIAWIRSEQGSERQAEIAKKVKYIFVTGDLVEGVGIYPDQDKDLAITDIYEQYNELAKHLKRIPRDKRIIICPGNHDAMRIAEPQPPLYKDFAEAVWNLPNVTMVSNPAYINIHRSESFPGFDVLMYHGFSFTYYADAVESIRNQGGQRRSDLIMKYLLQRRHLAPTHKSTLYIPDAQKDSLVIDRIPDFFASGHIHRTSAANYRNITMLNCSSWLEMTEYQEKVGLIPQPGRAILVNLQTRKVKIMRFYDDPQGEEQANEEQTPKW
ncbi:metallophosphoesterase [Candidatus Woesearchaeota archaeon]|nr:metallophosphoesterase [Candidatus Woesearchaeota archaeon]